MNKMPSQQPETLIHRIFEKAFNQGDLAVVDEVFSPDHFAHNSITRVPNGPQGFKLLITMLRNAFPDLHCTVDDEIHEGDKFSARWTLHGTHRGQFMGNPPTGKQVSVPGIIFGRTENGRIIEDWTMIDQMSILQQMGIIPPAVRL
jgi:steroid delta-isomerase-like uncharacterized protein